MTESKLILYKSHPLYLRIFQVLVFYRKPMTADAIAAIIFPDRDKKHFTAHEMKSMNRLVNKDMILMAEKQGATYYGVPIAFDKHW